LEACSRRSVPLSPLANGFVRARWQRRPAGHNDWDHFSVRAGWLSVPLQPWFFGYGHVNILDVLWKHKRLCIYSCVSFNWWTRLAEELFFTATVLSTFVFAFMFLINLFLIGSESAGAVPFGTILVVLLLWVLVSVPLTIAGGIFGKRHGPVINPVRVNQIPRQIPPGPSYLKPHWASLLGGILPFGAAFVELYFTLGSLFASRAYYAFGFVALTFMVVALTTATVSILFSYFILCAEEYRWQWRSFLVGGGSAAWIFLYGIYYWATQLRLDSFSSTVVYFGYLSLLSLLAFLCTASVGFLASYWAIRKLYSAIRID